MLSLLLGGDNMADYYYKKVIKDSDDNKFKRKPKYDNEKEEYELRKHDDKCHDDKCHDDKCHKCHDKKEKGIFTELVVDEHSSMDFPAPTNGTAPTPLNTRAQVKICVDDSDDEVLLQGTVEWTPGPITLVVAVLALLVDLAVPLGVIGTFRIWRSCNHGPFTPIFETSDTSTVNALNILGTIPLDVPLSLPLSTVTTSFHWVDKNPCCGDNIYILTLDVALSTDPMVDDDPITLLSSLIGPIRFATDTVVFTAAEIEDGD